MQRTEADDEGEQNDASAGQEPGQQDEDMQRAPKCKKCRSCSRKEAFEAMDLEMNRVLCIYSKIKSAFQTSRPASSIWSSMQPASICASGPPKIDFVDCVGIFCGACMYVGGVGRSEKFGRCMEIPAKS
eukprot:COSAG01_NODE_480_length_16473_cov_655.154208_20_plen_129_part_00